MKRKKILIDCIMHLGDMIMTSSVLPVLKQAYPDCEIHYLAQHKLAPIVELFPHVDKVISYKYKSKGDFLGVYFFAKKLKKEKYDISISLRSRSRMAIMMWLARIPIRINFMQIWTKEFKKNRFFTLKKPNFLIGM